MDRLSNRARRTVAAVAPLLIAAALLVGCGGSGSNGESAKNARQIITDAQKATMTASSVHVSGAGSSRNGPIKLDIVAAPSRGGGTIMSGKTVLNLVLEGASIYVKTDAATVQTLSGSAATASTDANRWLQTTSTDSKFTGLSQLLDITKLPQDFAFRGVPTKQSATTFAGVAVVPVFDPTSGGTLYVAATGRPYIIGIKGATSGGSQLTFDHYGSAKVPPAPANPIMLPGPSR
ncbi:MAG: hypothetical protein M3063_00925 [Actinomycetota bacterium]|nr:hypothetical protein [Actinomycetota bacterium]